MAELSVAYKRDFLCPNSLLSKRTNTGSNQSRLRNNRNVQVITETDYCFQCINLNEKLFDDLFEINTNLLKYCLFNRKTTSIENLHANNFVHLNGQLDIAEDQIICLDDIYLNLDVFKFIKYKYQFLFDAKRLTIELVIIQITTSVDYSHAAVSFPYNNGHSCIPILSTPFNVDMVLNTLWTQIEVVDLTNDGSGLGFGISGNKSTGVVVKAIVPGSIADKDGRIRTGDHLFQINHVCVRGMSAEQVAGILRQSSDEVRLVVARSVREPTATNNSPSGSQRPSVTSENFIRTRNPSSAMISDNDGIINNSQKKIFLRTERLLENNHNLEKILDNLLEQSQQEDGTELLDVTLEKGDDGLGITVAGYVSPDSTNNDAIAGIFIRDIAEGSVCARDGRLAIGDQIIEVNDQSLNGFSNVQALYLLQNTSSSVRLKVRRYTDGLKYEKIKEMISLESSQQTEEKIDLQNQFDLNEQIRQKWLKILGNNYEILIVDLYKPDNGNLGITLEGTIDVENGEKIGAHHYIRTLLSDGIIEKEGTLKSGDELLEINNQILYGKNHINVIEILKRVKNEIKLVGVRRKSIETNENTNTNTDKKLTSTRSRSISFGKTTEIVVKAKSLGTLDSTTNQLLRPTKTRSLEVISNLALWSTSILNIELTKGENGLGFSVLDYQDPSNPSFSPVIVIRALVPGGVAQLDGRLVPGDRLVAVNDITLENMNLNDVIKILKSTPKGPVKLSISKPLPYPKFKNDSDEKMMTDSEHDGNNHHHHRRLSRISKSKTTAEMINNQKRSASSHRSINTKPILSSGLALSAPAILCKHEYPETLLINKKNLINSFEQPIKSSINRSEKSSKRINSPKKTTFKSENILPLKSKESIDLSLQNLHSNLPEFIYFQSNHLVLTPKLTSPIRISSTNQTIKYNRPSNISRTPPPQLSSVYNQTMSSPIRRITRSRHSYDTVISNEKSQQQQQQKYSKRSMMNKYDSMSCFNEPDLSSDDNNHLIRSSSLTNQYSSRKTAHQSKTTANKINDIHQQDESSNNLLVKNHTSKASLSSQMASPVLSTSTQSSGRIRTLLNHEVIQVPVEYERGLIIKENFDQLNLVVDATVDDGVNGCCIRTITSTLANNCLEVGDFIVSVNHENMRKIGNAQARAIIRRAALVGSDISIIYMLADEIRQYKDQIFDTHLNASENLDSDNEISQSKLNDNDDDNANSPYNLDTENLCLSLWGPAHTVVLHRDEYIKNLGISIVGGKLDFSGPGNTIETCISGIFIKHVISDSLAGRHSTLKTGDRILEVNGYNLRDATHDHAVEIIRSASSPISFLVQSLLDLSNPIPYEKQYEYLNGDVLVIDIKRNEEEINEPLGLSLIGHRDPNKLAVFICDIQADSLIGRDNRLKISDQLLQVNDEILLGKAHSTVTSIIKSMKSDTLNFIILRNPNAINDMALNNPYLSKLDDKLISTSVPPHIKQTVDDDDDDNNNIDLSNQIITAATTKDIENKDEFHLISSDVNSSVIDQEKLELVPKLSSEIVSLINHEIITITRSINDYNGSFVSHIPMMSSSSSSSSVSRLHDRTYSNRFQSENATLSDLRTRPIVIGQETLIEIDRQQSGLGLSVVGGSDTQLSGIIIHDIYEGCAAHRDGRLLVGDQILEVNSVDLRSATHDEAIQALRQSTNIVRMVILRREMINEEDKFDIIIVDFIKKAGKGLGFSIIGRRQGSGVFISHIIEGGSAEKDGRLMSGDLILEVNNKDLRTATYEQVAYTLKTLPHARVYIKIGRLKGNASQIGSTHNKINDR